MKNIENRLKDLIREKTSKGNAIMQNFFEICEANMIDPKGIKLSHMGTAYNGEHGVIMEYQEFELSTYYKRVKFENMDYVVMDFLQNHILRLMPKEHKEKLLIERL